ncbi:MAG: LysR family transcriptional regulator [Rhodobacteraceae bacterium]|nr:LysR family transcriptional regulator [Paracoccaceae bacterium]
MSRRAFRGQLSDIDLRLLRVFDAVVTEGGFGAAEVALNKSRSAISMDISDLEQRLGVTLCRRGSRGFALTLEGERIHAAARTLFADLDRFRDSVNDTLSTLSGKIVVALTDDLVDAPALSIRRTVEAFRAANPDVYLHIRVASNMSVAQAVINSQADIGFAGRVRPVSGVEFTPLFEETGLAYCGTGHPFFAVPDADLDLDAVLDCDFVKVSVAEKQEPANLLDRISVSAEANNMDARAVMIMSGTFLGFLPVDYARDLVRAGRIRALLHDRLFIRNTIYRILRTGRQQSPLYREFLRWLDMARQEGTPAPAAAGEGRRDGMAGG